MDDIFEAEDKSKKKIHLTKERWKHILKEHPELSNKSESIKAIITNPEITKTSKYDKNVKWYYAYDKNRKSSAKYILVAVKYLNGSGFIITVFYTKKVGR
ncbi:hypothetical protein HYX19_01580 [Candidatus Woesearchaeota archaeon]|nr:hypothetical protein [Candidatus Woesearchaeota archaeon]